MKLLKLVAAVILALVSATPAFADSHTRLSCTIDKYSPLGRTRTSTLQSWVPQFIRIELSDSKKVKLIIRPGVEVEGEVTRELENKIAMNAVRKATDDNGRTTFMTYGLEWFTSDGRIFVSVNPQGYSRMGTAKGNCRTVFRQNTPDRAFGSAPVERVCNMATANGAWQRRQSLQKWVAEAQARGLTLEGCEKILKVN